MTKPVQTPAKNNFDLPTKALADAITKEAGEKLKPLTMLAYTAIDRIAPQTQMVVEALMTYADTDTLCYRSLDSAELAEQQKKEWTPILTWSSGKLGAIWQTTGSVMPVEQPAVLHEELQKYLNSLDAFQLSAASIISSLCSSLVLAMAVVEKQLSAKEAFRLSRLEEESQASRWGRDDEADKRAAKMEAEIIEAGEFLKLLDAA